jgi:hypothetical protein
VLLQDEWRRESAVERAKLEQEYQACLATFGDGHREADEGEAQLQDLQLQRRRAEMVSPSRRRERVHTHIAARSMAPFH